ncbi:hypothetical protein YC2023_010613 [Brassica napus]
MRALTIFPRKVANGLKRPKRRNIACFLDVGGYSSKVRYILLHVLLDFRCNRASRPTSCTILSFERSDIPWFLPLLGYEWSVQLARGSGRGSTSIDRHHCDDNQNSSKSANQCILMKFQEFATVSHAFSWLRGKGFISIFPFFSTRSKKIKTHSRVATDESRRLLRFQFSPSPIPSLAVSRLPLTFLKNAKGKRGHVYGLGSAQYGEQAPSSSVPNGLAHNLELEMRVGGLETSLQSVRQDVSEVKQDFASTRDAINQLLQTLRPQRAPTEQTFAQPQAPTTQP